MTATTLAIPSFLVTIAGTGGCPAPTVRPPSRSIKPWHYDHQIHPSSASLNLNGTQSVSSAIGYDQFGARSRRCNRASPGTKASRVGSIGTSGLYIAGSIAGSATITASSGSVVGSAAVTVTNAAPTVATPAAATPSSVTGTTTTLSALGADDGRRPRPSHTSWTVTAKPAGARRSRPTNCQRHERRQEHHRHLLPSRQLYLPGDHRRHRWFDHHQQRPRHGQSEPLTHDHCDFTVVGEPEP